MPSGVAVAVIDAIGERTIRDLVTERARRAPDQTFLTVEDRMGDVRSWSYAELLAGLERVAAGFASLGIAKGDAVVIHLPNCAEFVFGWLGLAWMGAVAVPSNVANTGPEMEHLVTLSDAVAVLTSPAYLDLISPLRHAIPALDHLILARTATPVDGAVLFDDWLSPDAPPPDLTGLADVHSEDVAEMVFTSGTTSRPKAVMLTHANYLHSGEREADCAAVDERDRLITALPAFHVNAQSNTILAALSVGATCILLEEYRATLFWQQVRRHEATAVSLVAMQLRTLLAQPPSAEDRDHSIRRNIYAINVSTQEKDAFEERFGLELVNGYGLSEAMTIVTVAPVHGDRRWPSIGLPAPGRTLRIVDEEGRDVPTGTPGELLVAGVMGRTLMKGYYKAPAATAAAVVDGWLSTGDNAYLDELGYLYFYDRKKDVIKRAGENISASEVEAALLEHPLIAEAAVIGVPDPIRDEAVKAFVVVAAGASLSIEQVDEHCRTRLARFKVPTVIEFMESLPKTSIGKIEKKALRQMGPAGASA